MTLTVLVQFNQKCHQKRQDNNLDIYYEVKGQGHTFRETNSTLMASFTLPCRARWRPLTGDKLLSGELSVGECDAVISSAGAVSSSYSQTPKLLRATHLAGADGSFLADVRSASETYSLERVFNIQGIIMYIIEALQILSSGFKLGINYTEKSFRHSVKIHYTTPLHHSLNGKVIIFSFIPCNFIIGLH